MNTKKVKLPGGYTAEVFGNSEFIIQEIWNEAYYDQDYSIKENSVIVDLGANQGFFSLYAASKGAYVYAVEPDYENFEILKRNIEANQLSDKIFPYHHAISLKDGDVEMFIPRAEQLCASGLITTNKELSNSFKELNVSHVEKAVIAGKSLSTFLKIIDQKKIDLLKIDCEGAELDILQSIQYNDAQIIDNIVMETHDAYSEKDLYYKVNELGFTITRYKKLQGAFFTGYLFANRSKPEEEASATSPIAILKTPAYGICHKGLRLDASNSFATLNKNSKLTYTWFINNVLQKDKHAAIEQFSFTENGAQHILLKVHDGLYENQMESYIWIFSEKYQIPKSALKLESIGKISNQNVFEIEKFVIPCEFLPKTWNYESIAIGITILNWEKLPQNNEIYFSFDGTITQITKKYQVVRFPHFPNSFDLSFHMLSAATLDIQFRWFAEEENKQKAEQVLFFSGQSAIHMGSKSKPHVCELEGFTLFIIDKNNLPTQWIPKCIKVCFSVHSSDKSDKPLTGNVQIKGRTEELQSGYIELVLTDKKPIDTLDFTVFVPDCRKYQITWWPE